MEDMIMPVVFDQVVGTVEAPSDSDSASGETEASPPPMAAQQMLAQMLRDREKRLARVSAD